MQILKGRNTATYCDPDMRFIVWNDDTADLNVISKYPRFIHFLVMWIINSDRPFKRPLSCRLENAVFII